MNINAHFQLEYQAQNNNSFILDVELNIPGKGVTAIFGQSGSGKTTLLRCIAGLEKANKGSLSVNGEQWQDQNSFLPTHQRPLGYVFQEASLFEHLTAEDNLQYAFKRSGLDRSPSLYQQMISLMGIDDLLEKYPHQLSGGERQRVAIARALLINPKVLLMDEPLASLDIPRKKEILPYIEQLRTELDIPILYVSHSINEIARLADYLVVLEQGKVIAEGTLTELLSRVDLPFTLDDESGILVEATVIEQDEQWQLLKVVFAGGELWIPDSGHSIGASIRIRILARDISLALSEQKDSSILNKLYGEVMEISSESHTALALVRLKIGTADSTIIIARLTQRSVAKLKLAEGSKVWAQIKTVAIVR